MPRKSLTERKNRASGTKSDEKSTESNQTQKSQPSTSNNPSQKQTKRKSSRNVEEKLENLKKQRTMDSDVESRRQKFYEQINWIPIQEQGMFSTPQHDDVENQGATVITSSSVMMSPGCPRSMRPGVLQEINTPSLTQSSHYQFRNIFPVQPLTRGTPLPTLSWADADELWHSMVAKESVYPRNSGYLARHENLDPRMRSILLDWMMEVSEVYRLCRETFYLATEYIDRYLSLTTNIHKSRLQLIGITALFVAAKLEEIYPPKLVEFSYVTDGACSEDEILAQELLLLSTLKWSLSPATPVSWLNLYLQVAHVTYTPGTSDDFLLPQYPQDNFIHIAQLLDLCALDIQSLDFSSSVLASAALYHFTSREIATQVSGYTFKEIAPCVHWMSPFAITIRDTGLQQLKSFSRVPRGDEHCVQTHANDISILDRVFQHRSFLHTQLTCQSPIEIGGFMTPPKSGQKPAIASPQQPSEIC